MLRLFGLLCTLAAIAFAQQDDVIQQMRKIWPNLPANQKPAEVANGKALFRSNCSFCHGPEATGGNGGPDLVRSVLVNHDEQGNLIGPTVRNGRPGKGMPAFSRFSDAQINDIVAFLHQKNRDVRIRFSYHLGNVETGNAPAGKTFFTAHCAACHSPQGDLAGIAAKSDSDQLQQLWLDPAHQPGSQRSIPPETVTVTLPSGQKFTGALKHVDEFEVSLFNADGYHSFPIEPGVQVTVQNPMQAHEDLLRHLTDADVHNVTTYLGTLK